MRTLYVLTFVLLGTLTITSVYAGNLTDDWFGQAGFASGAISRGEYERKFSSMDVDNDGKISLNEQNAFRNSGSNWFASAGFDTNGDGIITKAEYTARYTGMDQNNDGRISFDERTSFSNAAYANSGAGLNDIQPAAGLNKR